MNEATVLSAVRSPAVAGQFYPGDAAELRAMVSRWLAEAGQRVDADAPAPRAIIAPHAGYIYSGPVAASAYARLAKARDLIERVVLIGPAHRVAFAGLAASSDDAFATPLGVVRLDKRAIGRLLQLPFVHLLDEAHALEHSLETHLPFLQVMLERFTLVPLAMGQTTPQQVLQVLEALWDGPETLLVISSDLSHYHEYHEAVRMDSATSRAIEALSPADIAPDQACGQPAVQALLALARGHHLRARTVDQRNSGDTAGPRDRVVGYGAYVFAAAESQADRGAPAPATST